jgi:hypothetical protein
MKLTFFFSPGCAKCGVARPLFEDVCKEFGIQFELQNTMTVDGLSEYCLLIDEGKWNLPVAVFQADDGTRKIFQSALDFQRLLQN